MPLGVRGVSREMIPGDPVLFGMKPLNEGGKDMQVPFKMRIWLLLLSAIASAGCAMETTVLKPSSIAQDCTSANDHNNPVYPCPLPTMGAACTDSQGGVLPANSLKMFTPPFISPVSGWGDSYDAGTEPAPCWEWVSTFSRAYVRFDLAFWPGTVESIESASLSWKTKRLKGDSANACIKYLYEATGPWKRGETPANLLFDNLDATAVNGGFYGVVEQAKKWFANPATNFGFMIEPSRASTKAKSNSDCLESLEDLRLTVKYRK